MPTFTSDMEPRKSTASSVQWVDISLASNTPTLHAEMDSNHASSPISASHLWGLDVWSLCIAHVGTNSPLRHVFPHCIPTSSLYFNVSTNADYLYDDAHCYLSVASVATQSMKSMNYHYQYGQIAHILLTTTPLLRTTAQRAYTRRRPWVRLGGNLPSSLNPGIYEHCHWARRSIPSSRPVRNDCQCDVPFGVFHDERRRFRY